MTEREWFTVVDPERMLTWVGPRSSERKLRLFAAACCRHVAHLCRPKFEHTLLRAEEAAEAEGRARPRSRGRWPSLAALWMSRAESNLAHALSAADANQAATVSREQAEALARAGGDWVGERWFQAACLCDVFGNPFRTVAFSPDWRTTTVVQLAQGMYESRDFAPMPILADALQDVGCDDEEMLSHCRDPHQPHVRGCWVVDLVLGKV